jgi:hypothetical protein
LSRTGRYSAIALLTIGIALLASACSSGPSGGGSSNPERSKSSRSPSSQAVAFSHCMRSKGIANYPDPSSTNAPAGGVPKVSAQQLGGSLAQFQSAQSACEHLLSQGGQTAATGSDQFLTKMLHFAQCMRSHDVYNWPDPVAVGPQAPAGSPPYIFDLQGLQGLDGRSFSPQITHAINQCQRQTSLNMPYEG